METLNVLVEALGLVLGSFVAAIGISLVAWAAFARVRHPEWAAPAIALTLVLVLATHVMAGEFLSMLTILMVVAMPIIWIEGRAWRGRKSSELQGHGDIPSNFR